MYEDTIKKVLPPLLHIRQLDQTREQVEIIGTLLTFIETYVVGWDNDPDIVGIYGEFNEMKKRICTYNDLSDEDKDKYMEDAEKIAKQLGEVL